MCMPDFRPLFCTLILVPVGGKSSKQKKKFQKKEGDLDYEGKLIMELTRA